MIQLDVSWRKKKLFIAASYAAVLAFAAMAIIGRHYAELRDPATFQGGMAAFGDWMLELFLGAMLLGPTFLWALAVRSRDTASLTFARVLFVFSLTAPLSLGLTLIPAISQTNNELGFLCGDRLFGSPVALVGLAMSWLIVRHRPARRLIAFALLIETATLVSAVGLMFL